MSNSTWFYLNGDDAMGPCSEREIAAMLAARTLTADSSVRRAESDAWLPLKEVFAFAHETPPPLPAAHERLVATAAGTGAWTDTTPHPWRRYLGRMFDLLVFSTLSWLAIGFVAAALDPAFADALVEWESSRGGAIASTLLGVPLACIWSAIFIGHTGGTPGKWLLGVRVTDAAGHPPGLAIAAKREALVWLIGLGLAIPIASLATLLTSYARLDKERRTYWDQRLNLVVSHRPDGGSQLLLGAVAVALWLALSITLRLMP